MLKIWLYDLQKLLITQFNVTFSDVVDVVVTVRAEVNALVTDELNDAAFGLFVNAVTWSVDKPANWVADKLFTVAAGILVHALVVIDPILSAEIRAISAVLTPA